MTGYRYYSIEQLPRLYRILAFKGLGFSLEQIRQLLDEDLSSEQIRGMLRLKRAETMQRLEEEQIRLTYVETMIERIEREGTLSDYEVIIKKVEPILVASMRGVAKDQPDLTPTLNRMFTTVRNHIVENDGEILGHGTTLYHDEEWTGKDIQVEAVFPIKNPVQESDSVKMRTLPELESVASIIHKGHFKEMYRAYDALVEWINSNGYNICNSQREITLQFDPEGDPADWVTEIQFPVVKA
jgi:effector-binding domain-containing protein